MLAASLARTAKVCWPSLCGLVVNGEVQGVKAPPSTEHSKVAGLSLEVNSNVGVLLEIVPEGPLVIVVSGGVVSDGGGGGGGVVTV